MKKEDFKEKIQTILDNSNTEYKYSGSYDFISWINRRVFKQRSSIKNEKYPTKKSTVKKPSEGLFTYSMIEKIRSITRFEESISEISDPSWDDIHEVVKIFVKHHIRRFHPSNRLPLEDVSWDCFTHLYLNSFFGKYDPSSSKIWTYVAFGVKNYLIDLERKPSNRLDYVQDSALIFELLDNTTTLSGNEESTIFLSLLEYIRPEIIGQITFRKKPKYVQISKTQRVILSEYIVLHLSWLKYTFKDISQFFDVSPRYIGILYEKGVQLLKGIYENFNLEHSEPLEYEYDYKLLKLLSVVKKYAS